MTFSARERKQLASLLLELGPDAPTLCEGWTTHDMAIHLYLREHRPDALVGMFVPAASGHLEKVSAQTKKRGYAGIVRAWADGPGLLNPMRLADRIANLAEHFVHHEDVRRGEVMTGAEIPPPRPLPTPDVDALAKMVKAMASGILRKSTSTVVLKPTGREPIVVGEGKGNAVTVTGDAGELLLWIYGRDAVHLHIDGDAAAIDRMAM